MSGYRYDTVPSPWGDWTLVWRDGGDVVAAVVIPADGVSSLARARGIFAPLAAGTPSGAVARVRDGLVRMARGGDGRFRLEDVDLAACTPFARRVLAAAFRIPRGG